MSETNASPDSPSDAQSANVSESNRASIPVARACHAWARLYEHGQRACRDQKFRVTRDMLQHAPELSRDDSSSIKQTASVSDPK